MAVKATKQMAEAPRTTHMEARYLKDRFRSKLGLTADQAKVVDPILDKMSLDLKAVRSETTRRISAIVKSSYEQIGKELTPEQRAKLEEMKKERSESGHRKFKSPPDSLRKSNSPPQDL